jgi:hypothetical protein
MNTPNDLNKGREHYAWTCNPVKMGQALAILFTDLDSCAALASALSGSLPYETDDLHTHRAKSASAGLAKMLCRLRDCAEDLARFELDAHEIPDEMESYRPA